MTVSASAQETSRVERIKESGRISIGAPQASIPFSYLDDNQRPVGYSVEICQEVAKIISTELDIPDLQISHTATTSSTRLPLIQNGTIDLECGNTTNKASRKELVDFAPTTFISQVILAMRNGTDADVNDLSTFAGMTIAAQSGGQTYKVVADLNSKYGYGINLIDAPDTSRTWLLMESGRADAMVSDDGLIYAAAATSKNPDDFVLGTTGLEFAPYGIVEPKNDPEFKALVDRWSHHRTYG